MLFLRTPRLGTLSEKKMKMQSHPTVWAAVFGPNACGNVVGNVAVGLLSEELPVGLIFFRVQRVFLTTSA